MREAVLRPAISEATLERRLVLPGNDDEPFISGDFLVAAYQRGYRWGPDDVRQLLVDIKANADDAKRSRSAPSDYYLQPVVVLSRGDDVWELVDGQQRLTTLYLIAKYTQSGGDGVLQYSLSYETRNQQGNDSRHFLETLDPALRDSNIDFHHIAAAYDAIAKWFEDQPNPQKAANDIYNALSEWVYIIWYEAPAGTDPNELFTRLNRDRIALTDSELIKALVLSKSEEGRDDPVRREEVAAQWDTFERDLRDPQFWAFLTRSTTTRSTHIDFLFETMTPYSGKGSRPRYWTFHEVQQLIDVHGADEFWRSVVRLHGLLTGWFHDRELYHRVGYLVQIGDSLTDLIAESQKCEHSIFRDGLIERTCRNLDLTTSKLSTLSYEKHARKCTEVLLLMNVETVLGSDDLTSRFSFHSYAGGGWSLEHIHPQNPQDFNREDERRDWMRAHLSKITSTTWNEDRQSDVTSVVARIQAHLALPANRTDRRFDEIMRDVVDLFTARGPDSPLDDNHGLGNLALLQRDFNSRLNNAVFALKRERVIELDQDGAYLLPCTRNVFLKYYTAAADQQLSLWGPLDKDSYYQALVDKVTDFLTPDPVTSSEGGNL